MQQDDMNMTGYISVEGHINPSIKANAIFDISDFGCIHQGTFQLKPLTIFCGKNNTGKTWVMYALYGILNGLHIEKDLPEIQALANKLDKSGQMTWNPVVWLEKHFNTIEKTVQQAINQQLPHILNVAEDTLENSTFNYRLNKDWIKEYLNGLQLNSVIAVIGTQPALQVEKEHNQPEITFTILKTGLTDLKQQLTQFMIKHIAGSRYLGFASPFLLPSERNGLNLVFRELNFTRVQALHAGAMGSSELNNYLKRLSLYAKPIADYIDWLNTLSLSGKSILKVAPPMQSVATELEKISGGSYVIDAYSRISFISDDVQSDLHLASSTANSMAGLWFYLNGEGIGKAFGKGTTLMIDEPELNLHPSNQRAFARLLAKLINKGMKVIISTHSDYLVREINSLIMLSQRHVQHDDLMKKYDYSEEEVLKPEQIGAYLFDRNSIQAMDVTVEEGIIATTFDEVINELNETNDDIYYTYHNWNKNTEDAG